MSKYVVDLKRKFGIILFAVLLLTSQLPRASAAANILRLENGLTIIETIEVDSQNRASTTEKTVRKNFEITDGSTVIADFTIRGTFSFNGSEVKVISKEIVQYNTYDSWKFSQTSFTSSGGTITLSGKLTKVLSSKSISLSLSCDKDGNVS